MALTTCPECGRVLENEKECPNCGCPITSTTPSDKYLIPCHDCGHMVAVDATVCSKCGGKLTEKHSQGQLRILMQGDGNKSFETAPLYINGQLIDVISLSEGCDIAIPINNANVIVGYDAPLTYIQHAFKLDQTSNYTLVITNGTDLGFTLFDKSENKLVSDKMNIGWAIYAILFGGFAIIVSYQYYNRKPIWAKCMTLYGLIWPSFVLLGLPLAFINRKK